jgi:hypothetical protein
MVLHDAPATERIRFEVDGNTVSPQHPAAAVAAATAGTTTTDDNGTDGRACDRSTPSFPWTPLATGARRCPRISRRSF